MKYIDVFGGIGGFHYGINKATKGKWECVWYCDCDKYATKIYNKNFRTNYKPTDITKVNTKDIPDFDIFCGGFPCQSFSIAGKRKGFSDTRGTMFFEIARIVKDKKPSYIFLENVKGLLNHEGGKTFTTILQTLSELGYEYQWMVLNSRFFGVPQNRERVFIIANLRDKPRPKILPFKKDAREISKIFSKEEIKAYDIKGFDGKEKPFREYKGHTQTLTTSEVPMISNSSKREIEFKEVSPTLMKRDYKDPKIVYPTLSTELVHSTGRDFLRSGCEKINKVTGSLRRLTPIECERLQGFPDNWTEGVSNTQRYKQLGNAVTTNVIEAIVKSWIGDQ